MKKRIIAAVLLICAGILLGRFTAPESAAPPPVPSVSEYAREFAGNVRTALSDFCEQFCAAHLSSACRSC